MISYVKGKTILNNLNFLIVENCGVGYKVYVSPSISFKKGEECELFVHHHLKEDISDLYGFLTFEDLSIFQKLISVNGVGPKAGMAIMSKSHAEEIVNAIENENVSFFLSVPGIGKKVAARIILDLKSKLSKDSIIKLAEEKVSDDLIEALVSLGYKKADINKMMRHIPDDIETDQEKIRWVLKNQIKN